jgi:predicted ATP-grasp superfamily ATP-dependent carboligase
MAGKQRRPDTVVREPSHRPDTAAAVVPASRYPHGYASVRSLSEQGITTIAAVDDPDVPVTASNHCDHVAAVSPSHELDEYKQGLLELARHRGVQTIVPHRPQDPYVLAKHRDAFNPHVDLLVPSPSKLRRVHDRKRLFAEARAADVPIPETRSLDDAIGWDADRIVKSRFNLLTSDYHDGFEPGESKIVKETELVPTDQRLDPESIRDAMGHAPIVQRHVPGKKEYLFGALYYHGEAVATFQHRQRRGDSWVGGGGVYRESTYDPRLERVGRAILDHLDWHGLACIEYIVDEATGEFKLVEINPRMWQSLATAVASDADFPYWYWLLVTGRGDAIDPSYRSQVRTHYLYGELEHLVSLLREETPLAEQPALLTRIWEIIRSCATDPAFDTIHTDDLGPALQLLRSEGMDALARRLALGSH